MNSSAPHRDGVSQPPTEHPGQAGNRFVSQLPTVLGVLRDTAQPMTVPEIATAADCARVTVRRHLAQLRKTGEVTQVGTRPRKAEDGTRLPSRGCNVYALTEALTTAAA